MVPLLVSPTGQRVTSAFFLKDFAGTELDISTLRFEHPRAIAHHMQIASMLTGDNFHLRLELQKDDACIAYAMVPLRMSNSIHTHTKKEIRKDAIMIDELQHLLDIPLSSANDSSAQELPLPNV